MSLKVLIGVHGGGLNGIDAYAEEVAGAARAAGVRATLAAATPEVARGARERLGPGVEVVDLGLGARGTFRALAGRAWHGLVMRELAEGLRHSLEARGETFDAVHLNHPALAPAARPWARRLVVAAWFYPHEPLGRMVETWRHTRGAAARRAALAAKSLSYFLGDREGFRCADAIVAPTEALARQLASRGLVAIACSPPAAAMPHPEHAKEGEGRGRARELRLLACAGDLSHPRKNIGDVVEALERLARPGRAVTLVLAGRNADRIVARSKAPSPGIRIEAPGPLTREALSARMRAADVLVMPSLYEEWGYVAVESLLVGTPVAAYPVYPFESMLAGGLGSIALDKTPVALAEAIERAAAGWRGPDLAAVAEERFGVEAVGAKLVAIWSGAPGHDVPVAQRSKERLWRTGLTIQV